MTEQDDEGAEVGYGHPPKKTRFRKGESGNPKGRPKGARSLGDALMQELAGIVAVKEGGKETRITKGNALVKKLVNDAFKSNRGCSALILKFWSGHQPPVADEGLPLSSDDRKTLASALAWIKRQTTGTDDETE